MSLKEKIRQMNIEAGALAIRKVNSDSFLIQIIDLSSLSLSSSSKICVNN